MRILGIETSCDETAAAVVENGTKILSNVVASSAEMHAKSGGVIPEQAARQQVRSIIPVVEEAIRLSGVNYQYIDVLAVTVGPGLIGSLLVGVETAKTLAYLWNKPIVPVNHLVAHIYANWLDSKPEFPALALVVSGGHTDLVLMRGHGKLKWIGGTRDDAAGEAFDKCARLLGLPYPGGPSIAKEAMKYQITNNKLQMFPRPMIEEDNFDWSFSGLKTAVLREVSKMKLEDRNWKMDNEVRSGKKSNIKHQNPASSLKPLASRLAAEVQEAICDVLIKKTMRAVREFKPKSLLLAGGVAANSRLRVKFSDEINSKKIPIVLHVPKPALCTDNAVYIASYANFNFKPLPWEKISANPELTITTHV